jgi:hypothetical protein
MLFQEKLWRLVNDLFTGTSKNAIRWSETPDEETFRTVLEKGMVRIERGGTGTGSGYYPADSDYWLLVFDEDNREIARFVPESPEQKMTLGNLWELANSSARNTEQKLDFLLKEVAGKSSGGLAVPARK